MLVAQYKNIVKLDKVEFFRDYTINNPYQMNLGTL